MCASSIVRVPVPTSSPLPAHRWPAARDWCRLRQYRSIEWLVWLLERVFSATPFVLRSVPVMSWIFPSDCCLSWHSSSQDGEDLRRWEKRLEVRCPRLTWLPARSLSWRKLRWDSVFVALVSLPIPWGYLDLPWSFANHTWCSCLRHIPIRPFVAWSHRQPGEIDHRPPGRRFDRLFAPARRTALSPSEKRSRRIRRKISWSSFSCWPIPFRFDWLLGVWLVATRINR